MVEIVLAHTAVAVIIIKKSTLFFAYVCFSSSLTHTHKLSVAACLIPSTQSGNILLLYSNRWIVVLTASIQLWSGILDNTIIIRKKERMSLCLWKKNEGEKGEQNRALDAALWHVHKKSHIELVAILCKQQRSLINQYNQFFRFNKLWDVLIYRLSILPFLSRIEKHIDSHIMRACT